MKSHRMWVFGRCPTTMHKSWNLKSSPQYKYYILFIDAWVTKTLDLKYSAGYKQHPTMLIIKVKTFITNLVYGPVSSWAYLITWEFSSLCAVLMSSSFNFLVLCQWWFLARNSLPAWSNPGRPHPTRLWWNGLMTSLHHPLGSGPTQLYQPRSVACRHVTIYYQLKWVSS